MKNNFKLLGIIALVAVMVSVSGCAVMSTVGGSTDMHGFFSSSPRNVSSAVGGTEIASYSVILGLFDSGYADYATKVKAAEDAGRKITTVTTWLVFIVKTTAYAR